MKRLSITEAISLLKQEQVVALPSETVYGLAARCDSVTAVQRIFEAKQRPANNPLICHVSSVEMLKEYAVLDDDDDNRNLFSLWPGPLTLLLRRQSNIPDIVTAGSPYCAFRMPAHDTFLKVIEGVKVPLAAPSANQSGRTSPVTAGMVEVSLEGRIAGVVDGGQCRVGIESTVALRENKSIYILRPGAIQPDHFKHLGFQVHFGPPKDIQTQIAPETQGLLSPGQLPVHYAPAVPLIVIEAKADTAAISEDFLSKLKMIESAQNFDDFLQIENQRIAIQNTDFSQPVWIAQPKSDDEYAATLYNQLTDAGKHASVIFAFAAKNSGIGIAINDRLQRAASIWCRPK